jgi:hypothetical protein
MILYDLKENALSAALRTVINFIVAQFQWLVFKIQYIMYYIQGKLSLLTLRLHPGYRLSNSSTLLRISCYHFMHIYKLTNSLNPFF